MELLLGVALKTISNYLDHISPAESIQLSLMKAAKPARNR
jgi:hypothetical protein